MPPNQAAWMTGKATYPLEVKSAPYTPPREMEIVVKNRAVAINPIDWVLQSMMGGLIFPWLKYPLILGWDLAGDVVEVGKGITRFQVGDRVVGLAVSSDKRSNGAPEGAFQEYTVIRDNLASPIPDSLSYEKACVLPLGLSTAACGLFQNDFLALQYPTVSPSRTSNSTGETLLVWGGSSSVGSNTIQLATAAGYEVITTASPKNFDYVRKLGATKVFDYRSKSVIQDITKAFENRRCAGALAMGDNSLAACIDIVAASKGKKFVAHATAPLPEELPTSTMGMVGPMAGYVRYNVAMWVKSKTKRVNIKFLFGAELMANKVGRVIYEDFLPAALAQGKFIVAPEPHVVGKGLNRVQEAMDLQKKGVSAKKIVVSL